MNKLIKNLAVAAAVSIAIIGVYTPATASANGGSWQRDSVGWWYKNSNGSYPKNDWQQIDGKWYYFDGRGYITHSKWERIKDYWYYFNTSGHMTENDWKMIGDKWYYFDNKGHMLSSQWVGDYYVGRDGYMLKNTITPDNYVVGSDGKWDKRFSRELAEKAKNRFNDQYLNLYYSDHSKYAEAYNITFRNRGEYNTALQLIEIIYPEYNAVDNAKRAIKNMIGKMDNDNNHYDWMSKDLSIRVLTAWHVDTNNHSSYMFSQEEVKKAFDELSHEINLPKVFQRQAIKALKMIDSSMHTSKAQYERYLSKHGFTKEEIDNAFNTVKIDFAYNAQLKATTNCTTCADSKESTIQRLVKGYGFTRKEAEEGVNRLNYDFKINLRNFIEGNFTTTNATWAGSISKEFIVDHTVRNLLFEESEVREVLAEYNINYTERARLRAIDILKNGKYSRSNLIKTLTGYWKFTEEEATNAVKDLKHENLID